MKTLLVSVVERDGRCFAYYATKTSVQISQHVDISAVVRGYSYRVAISVVVEDIMYNGLVNIDSINYNYTHFKTHSKTECSINLQKLPRFSLLEQNHFPKERIHMYVILLSKFLATRNAINLFLKSFDKRFFQTHNNSPAYFQASAPRATNALC